MLLVDLPETLSFFHSLHLHIVFLFDLFKMHYIFVAKVLINKGNFNECIVLD